MRRLTVASPVVGAAVFVLAVLIQPAGALTVPGIQHSRTHTHTHTHRG